MTFSLVLKAVQLVLGSWNPEFTICPFRAEYGLVKLPKHYVLKGKWPILKRKNTIKQGKKTPKGQMVPISRVYMLPLRLAQTLRGNWGFVYGELMIATSVLGQEVCLNVSRSEEGSGF